MKQPYRIPIIGSNFLNGFSKQNLIFRGSLIALFGIALFLPVQYLNYILWAMGALLIANGLGAFRYQVADTDGAYRWVYPILVIILGALAIVVTLKPVVDKVLLMMDADLNSLAFWFISAWFIIMGVAHVLLLFIPGGEDHKSFVGISVVFYFLIGLLVLIMPFTIGMIAITMAGILLIACGFFTIIIGCFMHKLVAPPTEVALVEQEELYKTQIRLEKTKVELEKAKDELYKTQIRISSAKKGK